MSEKEVNPSIFRRIFALQIDFIIIFVIGFVLTLPFGDQFSSRPNLPGWILFVLALIYFSYFESRAGLACSPGKSILGIRLVSKAPVAIYQAGLRKFFVLFPFANNLFGSLPPFNNPAISLFTGPVFFGFLGFCLIGTLVIPIFHRESRGFHDFLFGTQVIFENRKSTAQFSPLRVWHSVILALTVLAIITFSGRSIWKVQESLASNSDLSSIQKVQQELQNLTQNENLSVSLNTFTMSSVNERNMTKSIIIRIPVGLGSTSPDLRSEMTSVILPKVREHLGDVEIDAVTFVFEQKKYWGIFHTSHQDSFSLPFSEE